MISETGSCARFNFAAAVYYSQLQFFFLRGGGMKILMKTALLCNNAAVFLLSVPIYAYKRLISPFLPSACRFYPTCSQYAIIALRKHGAIRGLFLALWRLLRCTPLSKGGYDPVPGVKYLSMSVTFKR